MRTSSAAITTTTRALQFTRMSCIFFLPRRMSNLLLCDTHHDVSSHVGVAHRRSTCSDVPASHAFASFRHVHVARVRPIHVWTCGSRFGARAQAAMRGRTVLLADLCRSPSPSSSSTDAYVNPFVVEGGRRVEEDAKWYHGARLALQRRWVVGGGERWSYVSRMRVAKPCDVEADEGGGEAKEAWRRVGDAFVPLVVAAGARLDVEPVHVHPQLGCRFGRALKVQALPHPTVRMRASWEVPKCGVLVQLQYTLPIQKEWKHAPGKLELRLADARRKWLKVASDGIEVDAKTWRIADAAALRVHARADVVRELPRKQNEPLVHVEIDRLGVQAVL